MLVKEILQKLDLGSSVAEYDAALERYFVETSTFRSLIRDEGDVIAGDKGTGKTALCPLCEYWEREPISRGGPRRGVRIAGDADRC